MKNSKIAWLAIYSGIAAAFNYLMMVILTFIVPIGWALLFVVVISIGAVISGEDDIELTKALEYDKAVWVSYEEDAWFVASDANEAKYGFRCVGKLKHNDKWYDFIPNVGLHGDGIGGYVFPDGIEEAVDEGYVNLDEGVQIYIGLQSVDDYEYPTYTIDIDKVTDTFYMSKNELWMDFERLDGLSYQEVYETVYSDISFKLNYDDTCSLYAGDKVKEGKVLYEGRYIALKISRNEIYVFENSGGSLIYSAAYSINDEKISDGKAFYATSEGGYDYE